MKTHTFEISASASKHGGGTAASYDDPDKKIIERVTYSVRSEVTLARDPYLTFTENLQNAPLHLAGTGRDYVTKWKGLIYSIGQIHYLFGIGGHDFEVYPKR